MGGCRRRQASDRSAQLDGKEHSTSGAHPSKANAIWVWQEARLPIGHRESSRLRKDNVWRLQIPCAVRVRSTEPAQETTRLFCCAKKSTDYNFTKLEKRLRLMRRGQKGRRFEIINKLLGPTSVVGHTDELLR